MLDKCRLTADYSFCESVYATGRSPWHIRRLTAVGKKLGGGVDLESLCGRIMCWDIEANECVMSCVCEECLRRLTGPLNEE